MRLTTPWPASQKLKAMCSSLPFLYGSNAGLEMTSGFYGLQALHTRAHLLQAVYEGVVFSRMTHLNRMLERFPRVQTLRVTGGPPIRTCGCRCSRTSAARRLNSRWKRPAVPVRRWPRSSVQASIPILRRSARSQA